VTQDPKGVSMTLFRLLVVDEKALTTRNIVEAKIYLYRTKINTDKDQNGKTNVVTFQETARYSSTTTQPPVTMLAFDRNCQIVERGTPPLFSARSHPHVVQYICICVHASFGQPISDHKVYFLFLHSLNWCTRCNKLK